jgi:hypothetical protein
MGILAKLFNATPHEQLKGVSLGKNARWEVSPTRDFPLLLEALPKILPKDQFFISREELRQRRLVHFWIPTAFQKKRTWRWERFGQNHRLSTCLQQHTTW